MSLQYVIDGYNLIKHPLFARINKKIKDEKLALLEFIRTRKLTGSSKNTVTVVFDGYPDTRESKHDTEIEVIFARKDSADERIKRMVEESGSPRNTIVVSDDKEIRFFVRSLGAIALGVEEFIIRKEKLKRQQEDSPKPQLSYSAMQKINQELRQRWLK